MPRPHPKASHDGDMDLSRPVPPDPYSQLPAVPTFSLTSENMTDGAPLAGEHAARDASDTAEANISPQLSWSGFPEETQSFVVSCFDPDAPTPSGYWHWTIVDLPATCVSLAQGDGHSDLMLDGAAFHVRSDGGAFGYEGAAPPKGDRAHRYVFAVHALDVDSLDLDPEDSPTKVAFTALFHTIARATLTVTYQR